MEFVLRVDAQSPQPDAGGTQPEGQQQRADAGVLVTYRSQAGSVKVRGAGRQGGRQAGRQAGREGPWAGCLQTGRAWPAWRLGPSLCVDTQTACRRLCCCPMQYLYPLQQPISDGGTQKKRMDALRCANTRGPLTTRLHIGAVLHLSRTRIPIQGRG
jgi:hypothetical protein